MPGSNGEWLGFAKAAMDQWGLTLFIGSVLMVKLGMVVFHMLFDRD